MKKCFRQIFTVFLVVAFLFGMQGCGSGPAAKKDVSYQLVILHTNDHHGHPLAFYDYPAADQGGLPARATLVKQVRGANARVLVLDAGDFNTGRPESNFFQAEPDLIGYNYIGYDAVEMGNHEFDPDAETRQKQIAMSDFPWLCANVVQADGSLLPGVQEYMIKDYGDFKVAVFGLMLKETEQSGNPAHVKDFTFLDEVEVANKLVPMLQKKADLVIALVHLGVYPGENRGSRRLAAEVPGIDLVIDGHSHTMLEHPLLIKNKVSGKEVPIVQARHWGLYMGKVTLDFMNGEVTKLDYELVPVNVRKRVKQDDGTSIYPTVGTELEKDPELLALLKPFADKVDAVLGEVIGTATAPLINDKSREAETAIGDAVADSMLWYAREMGQDVDFALQNGGGVRTTLGEGEIKKADIYEVIPFDNTVVISALKGSDVIAMFDYMPQTIGHGAMPQVSDGVSFVIDKASGKVSDVLINGEAIDPDKTYKIATNSYLGAGGDGYVMFKNAVDLYDMAIMQRDAFIEWVISARDGILKPETFGRITIK